MDGSELAAGTDIAGRYEIKTRLGGGGSAQTYAALERSSGRMVAIKVFTLRGGAWKSFELFEREAIILARLDHPAIPKLVESFTAETANGPTFYLVESFVEGKTLAEEAGSQRADEAGARRVAVELLAILSYLQRLNPPVVHRDVKPANILRTSTGSLSLVDFGSVRSKDPDAEASATTIVGTYGFMAPEQYRGLALPATDLHGLGATLVFVMTGRAPDQLPQHKLKPELPSTLRLSPQFKAWLDKLLEPAPEDRFQSAEEAAIALSSNELGRPRRSRRVWALAGAAVMLAGGAAALTYKDVIAAFQDAPAPQAPARAPVPRQGRLMPMPALSRRPDIKSVTTIAAHTSPVRCVQTSPDGRMLLTSAGDGALNVWSTETWSVARTLPGHTGRVFGCGFTADGKSIVSTGESGIRVFDAASGAPGPAATAAVPLYHLRVQEDRVIAGSAGKEAFVWKLPDLTPLPPVTHDSAVLGVGLSRTGSMTALAGESGLVRLLKPGAEPLDLWIHAGPADSVSFSPDGAMLASSGDDGTVRIWSVRDGRLMGTVSGSPDTEAWNLAWTPDGSTLLVADKAGTLSSFRFPLGQMRWRWRMGRDALTSLSISNDGKLVFVGVATGSVHVLATPRPASPDSVPPPPAGLKDPAPLPGLAREAERILNADNGQRAPALAQAEALTTRALEQNPRDALALVQRARITRFRGYLSGSKYRPEALEGAKALVDEALGLQPKLPEAHAFLTTYHTSIAETLPATDSHRFDPARASLAQLVQLEPASARTFLLQAALLNAEGLAADARQSALRAVELAASSREVQMAYTQLAEAYEHLADPEAADACHRRKLELDPTSAWLRGNYALFLRKRGLLEEARNMVHAAIKLSDYPIAHHYLATIQAEMGIDALWSMRDPSRAKALFEAALKENPKEGDALYGLVAVEYFEASLKDQLCPTCADKLVAAQKLDPSNEAIKAGLVGFGAGKK